MTKPIAFDLSKLIINVSRTERTMECVQTGLGNVGTRKIHYSFPEQVVLALVETLTFSKKQHHPARKAKRLGALKRQTTKRVTALRRLLETA
jgi:hypothetical protein